jgi:hypothetical protein
LIRFAGTRRFDQVLGAHEAADVLGVEWRLHRSTINNRIAVK